MNKSKIEYLRKTLLMRSEMRKGEYKWEDLLKLREEYQMSPICKDNFRKAFPILDELEDEGFKIISPEQSGNNNYRETYEINKNGTFTSDKVINLEEIDREKPESLLKAHGFDPKKYDLISARNSVWEQGRKGEKINLYTSKITVQPKAKTGISFEDIDNYFDSKEFNYVKNLVIPPKSYESFEDFLEVDITDLHFGLFASKEITSDADFSMEIAEEYFKKSIDDIICRINNQNRKYKRIVIALLGDILHVNNADNKTCHGTPQDVDALFPLMFDKALDMLIEAIEKFAEIAPVEVVSVNGNHDEESGYMLVKAVEKAFRKVDGIKFFNNSNPRKARLYGKCLIGWMHGDVKKDKCFDWIKDDFKTEYGQSEFVEIHSGHIHSIETKEKEGSGVLLRRLSNLCPASSWEHREAYNKGMKAITSFVWNENEGIKEIWYSSVF